MFSFLVVGGFVVGGCASCEGEPRFRPETPGERGPEGHGEASLEATRGDPDLPGVARVDDALTARLRAASSSEAGHDRRFVNRLALEASPYLRQHAGNPVNWFPWGPEALARARALDRPIFLSIGYATCHWCHVMEVESFEDEEIARYLNEHFVCIKVDREERPDLDEIYMSAVQALTGRGGWPMTTVLMPDTLEPFFGGTYFPPRAGVRGSRMGLQEILRTLVERFTDDREGARSEASALATRLRGMSRSRPSDTLPPPQALGMAVAQLERSFHPVDGGFGGAPRFPQPSRLLLLLDHHARGGDARAQEVVDFTIERMAEGGIRDHVGGGFHRYATDARWRIPHFEKMLYDNAQLVIAFVEAWRASTTTAGRARYEALIHETLSYLTREMQHEGGAFFAATDADSRSAEGEMLEGAFFTWTRAEIESALGASAAGVFFARFDLEVDHELGDRGVIYAARSVADAATQAGMGETQLRESLTSSLSRLREVRAPRPPPSRDDAILAAWNGLAISALARAGFALEQEAWVNEGVRAFDFIWSHMRDDEGRLIRSWVDGRTGELAFADDHAALLEAALDLYEASGDARFIERATELFAALEAGFADPQTGAYFLSRESHEAPIARPAADDDGATPSATSMATRALLRLSELTGDDHAAERAQELLRATGDRLVRAPIAYPHLLLGLARAYASPREVAIVRPDADTSDAALLAVLRRTRAPHVLVRVHEAQIAPTSARVPWLSGKTAIGGRATAYVCEQGRCEAPTSEPRELAAQLARALE